MSKMQDYKNWRLEKDADNILWLYFDKEHATANTIDQPVMEELSDILDHIKNYSGYKGVVIASAKNSGFIAGADISQFTQFSDLAQAEKLLLRGHAILNKLEALKIPTVAMIDGFCLGGGLELA